MVGLLGVLCKARNNLRATGLGHSREEDCQWWRPSLRRPVVIPGLLAQTPFNGFSLTAGKPPTSHAHPLSAPYSLLPALSLRWLLMEFHSPRSRSAMPGALPALWIWPMRLPVLEWTFLQPLPRSDASRDSAIILQDSVLGALPYALPWPPQAVDSFKNSDCLNSTHSSPMRWT